MQLALKAADICVAKWRPLGRSKSVSITDFCDDRKPVCDFPFV